MGKKTTTIKEAIFIVLGCIIIIIAISGFVYDKFFYEPEPYIPMSAQERKELEQRLIDRYGSLDNIPTNERDCFDYGEGKGCW